MDKVIELDVKESCSGAPCPRIMSDEHNLFVAYYLQDTPKDFELEAIGLVRFELFHAYQFGPPNDEAFHGHPLYKKGLKPYGTFKIEGSSWLKEFCSRNRVHPYHKDEQFNEYEHFIWSFHDTTLEVIAKNYSFSLKQGTPQSVIQQIVVNSEW
jgi:hypothetical protein